MEQELEDILVSALQQLVIDSDRADEQVRETKRVCGYAIINSTIQEPKVRESYKQQFNYMFQYA